MSELFPAGRVPVSGEVQFWRMDPDSWQSALSAVKSLGIDTVATYLSWRRHEPTPGSFDLAGGHGRELDVHRFLDLCRAEGLRVILKPGPWICAEEPNGGLPDWIVQDGSMLALDHEGRPVMGYNPPFVHPMPSYASRAFRARTQEWIASVWRDLADYLAPAGPVVATQYDNEPSLGFRDSMYGFDHHPDALAAWRAYSGTDAAPPQPRQGGPSAPTDLEIEWAHWQRHYIADYLRWLQNVTIDAGAGHLVGSVNLNTHPVRGWPQDGGAIASAVTDAVVGEDHYFVPPLDESDLAGLALAAAQAMTTSTTLVWAPEIQAGIWRSPGEPIDYPDPTVDELVGWWGAALALGYQGFNLYMLVNRENWELAPLANDGSMTALGSGLATLLSTASRVTDLAAFRPVTDVSLAWNDELRISAYRVRGTQAEPETTWDDPAARLEYDRTESDALAAIRAGMQFGLGSARQTASSPSVAAPRGYLARVHAHPDGRRVLYLVRWARDAARGPIELVVRDDVRIEALERVRDGASHAVRARRVIVDECEGFELFRIV